MINIFFKKFSFDQSLIVVALDMCVEIEIQIADIWLIIIIIILFLVPHKEGPLHDIVMMVV